MEKENKIQQVDIDYVFNAPRKKVFETWTKKENLAEWFAPDGCTFKFKKLDIREGGSFHYCVSNPDFGDCWCVGVYKEIKSPEKIVYTLANADEHGNKIDPVSIGMDPEWPGETLVSVFFTEKEGKTTVRLKQTVSETVAKRTGAHPSWILMLKKLEALLMSNSFN